MTVLNKGIELIKNSNPTDIKAIIFDFDGTISTLRHGWEEIMENYMYEMISGEKEGNDEELKNEIKVYINESMGIQTIYQMQWLKRKVELENKADILDIWEYKKRYNDRLMDIVRQKTKKLISKKLTPKDFRIINSKEFVKELYELGYKLYIASGTDHDDVVKEMKALEIFEYFEDVKGAPANKIDCPKEAIVKHLMEDLGYKGNEIAIIGDGKVEIEIAVRIGGKAIGMATNETTQIGVNQRKRKKLINAGAHIIAPHFKEKESIIQWIKN